MEEEKRQGRTSGGLRLRKRTWRGVQGTEEMLPEPDTHKNTRRNIHSKHSLIETPFPRKTQLQSHVQGDG